MTFVLLHIILAHCIVLTLNTHAFKLDNRCPFECQCDEVRATCRGMRHREFPTWFPINIEILEVTESNFQDVPQNVLSGFRSLKSFKITKSSIKYIHTCAFSGVSDMTSITLSDVNITEIVQNGFHNMKDIQQLTIENSYIHEIASYAFNNIQNVTKFKIQNVTIMQFDHAAINKLKNVSNFELIGNTFQTLESKPLTKFMAIETMEISRNIFHSVLCGIENMLGKGVFKFIENRLQCVCNMPFFSQTRGRPLLGALSDIATFSNNSCAGPNLLAGTLVEDVDHVSICTGNDENNDPNTICPPTLSMQEIHNCHAFGAPLVPVDEVEVPTTRSTNGNTGLKFSNFIYVLMVVISSVL